MRWTPNSFHRTVRHLCFIFVLNLRPADLAVEMRMLRLQDKRSCLVKWRGGQKSLRKQIGKGSHLVQLWIRNEIFIPEQFGFLKGKSCLRKLLSPFYDWDRERNKGLITDAIFIDLWKAFDSVPHERVLAKIYAYGIRSPLLSWLRYFLTNRYQRVVLQGCYSSWASFLSGVLQGTVFPCFIPHL